MVHHLLRRSGSTVQCRQAEDRTAAPARPAPGRSPPRTRSGAGSGRSALQLRPKLRLRSHTAAWTGEARATAFLCLSRAEDAGFESARALTQNRFPSRRTVIQVGSEWRMESECLAHNRRPSRNQELRRAREREVALPQRTAGKEHSGTGLIVKNQGPPQQGAHTLSSCRSLRTLSFGALSALWLSTTTLSALRR
jgi:hypothetical protein